MKEKQNSRNRKVTLKEYVDILYEVANYFTENLKKKTIHISVHLLLSDLYKQECTEELKSCLGPKIAQELSEEELRDFSMEVFDYKKMAGYSYYVLTREADRFL